jgi:uncharacterized protein YmfQ (DUF2313 family)
MSTQPFSLLDYLAGTLRLLPRGRAWPRDPDTVLARLVAAITGAFQRADAAACALLKDAFPATAVNLLPEWEASLGLPDPCLGPAPTIAARQGQVVARLTNTGGQSVPFFVAYALALGFVITITEFTGSVTLANTWRVNVFGVSTEHFEAGSFAGDYLSVVSSAADVLECEFKRLKPAHTILTWQFLPGVFPSLDFSKPSNSMYLGAI